MPQEFQRTSRPSTLFKTLALVLAACTAPMAQAAITVTLVDGAASQDTVVITSDAADTIAVSCASGFFAVNGSAVLASTLACNAKPNLIVRGGPLSNLIDLSAVTQAEFAPALRINVLSGAGADTINGSAYSESLDGGLGDDLISGGAGDDVMRWLPGDGSDTLDGQGGVDRMDFIGSAAVESFRVALIGPSFPTGNISLQFIRNVGNITMRLSNVEEIFVDGVSGADQATIDDVRALGVTQTTFNFGVSAGVNSVVAAGTNGIDNFSLSEPLPGLVLIDGASVPITLLGLKPADSLLLQGLGGADQFQVPSTLSERLSLTFAGGDGVDGARMAGDLRDERYRFVDAAGTVILSREAPTGRVVSFLGIESIELDTGDGVDEVNTLPLASTALVLAGGAPGITRGDTLIVQQFAGATDVSPINPAGAQPIIFNGFERTDEYVVHSLSNGGFASLRDRVSDAVLRAGRFVTFAPGVGGSIVLDTPITLGGSVNIIGPGANLLELRSNNFSGMLLNPAGSNAFVSGLGIRGLQSGFFIQFAIDNQGAMSLNQLDVSDNAAVAIRNSGDMTLRNSSFINNRDLNAASPIQNSGTLRIINSTLAANLISPGSGQGVIRNDALGQLSLINSTVARNTMIFGSGDAGLLNNGAAQVFNSIISENAGVQIRGNALNPASSNNLIGNNAVALGPLLNNGGATATLAIFADGPAHNTGNSAQVNVANFGAAPFSDQRGAPFVRIDGSAVDIGAFELQPLPEVIFSSGFE